MRRRGVGRAGRPSLLGTAARTAVVAGTASAVAGNVSARQQANARQAADAEAFRLQQAAAAATPTAPSADAGTSAVDQMIAQLAQLGSLRDQGILTDAEFEVQKARLLA